MRKLLVTCVLSVATVLALLVSAMPVTANPGNGWGTGVQIDSGNYGTSHVDIASSADGSSIAVWNRIVGTMVHISWNRYTPGGGWTGVGDLESADHPSRMPRVAMDDTGNAIAVWNQQSDYSLFTHHDQISAAYYSPIGGWSGVWGISDYSSSYFGNPADVAEPELAMDDQGRAVAAWIFGDHVYANVFIPGMGTPWQGEIQLSDGAATPTNLHVAMGHSAAGLVVWEQANSIWANTYSASGWEGPSKRLSATSGLSGFSYHNPTVAIDRADNVVILAERTGGFVLPGHNPARTILAVAREGGSWGSETWVSSGADCFNPSVAVNAGRAVAVWNQSQGAKLGGRSDIWANLWASGSGWGNAQALEVGQYSDGIEPVVVIDASGNAVAAWRQYVHHAPFLVLPYDSWDIWGDRYVTEGGGSWSITTIDSATGTAEKPRIALGANGVATVVWNQWYGSVQQVWANRFDPDTESPVANAGPDQTVEVGTQVTFNSGGSTDNVGITNRTWTFNDGGARTLYGSSPKYTFSSVGTFTVTLTVRDAEWNVASDTVVITVQDTTPPVANAGPDQTVGVGSLVTFDGSSSTDNVGVVNWTWSFQDPVGKTLWGVAPTYTFNHLGAFTVRLNVTDAAGNWGVDTVEITVQDKTAPTANAGADQTVNKGTTVNLDGSGSSDNVAVTSYTWTFNDGGAKSLSGVHQTYAFNNAGVFVVTLNVTDAAGNYDLDTVTITVNTPDIERPVANAGPDQTVKVGDTVVFDGSGSSDNVGVANFTWTLTYGGATKTLYNANPTMKFDIAGDYTVTLTVKDAAGNPHSDTVTIHVEKSGGAGVSTLLIAGIGVAAVIAIVAAALLLMRRKGPGAPPTG